MNSIIAAAPALVATINALVIHDGGCTFKLTSSGGATGEVSQLVDGQNRVGASGLSVATYIIGANGGIFDQNGRGCTLTPQTTQLQCDAGGSSTAGFSIACDGTFSHNGNPQFVACQTGDNGWSIFTTYPRAQTGCVDISLSAGSCRPRCPPAPANPSASSSPSHASTAATSPSGPPLVIQKCPVDLSGTFESPHLIVPVSSSKPGKAYGTSRNGQVSRSDLGSIFNFDIKPPAAGRTCALVFSFPRQDQLTASSFMINGDANVAFASLVGPVDQNTTHSNAPGVAKDYGS